FRSLVTGIIDDGVFHSDMHPGNVMITEEGQLALLDFGSIGRLDSELRGTMREVLLAVSQRNSRAFADALLSFVDQAEIIDEHRLRRDIGEFMSKYLSPGGELDSQAFTRVVGILSAHGIAIPAELLTA